MQQVSEDARGQPTGFLRALKQQERCLYRSTRRNGLPLVLVAEFNTALTAPRVSLALEAVRCRHPLLSAHIKSHPDKGLSFYRNDMSTAIELKFHLDAYRDWREFAAEEISRPFNPSALRLMRAALVARPTTSTLLLTFDRIIADGISSVLLLNDLLDTLNNEQLAMWPLPTSLRTWLVVDPAFLKRR